MVVLATVAAAWLGYRWAVRHNGLEPGKVGWALFVIALSTFACARLHFVVTHWVFFQTYPWRALALSPGALHAPGAVIGAVLGGALVVRILSLPARQFVDALAAR
jgi:prolipoprotein diacylglyceryltransferase